MQRRAIVLAAVAGIADVISIHRAGAADPIRSTQIQAASPIKHVEFPPK